MFEKHGKTNELILIFVSVIAIIVFATNKSFSYFDDMSSQRPEWIPIGEWFNENEIVEPTTLVNYIDMFDTYIETQPNKEDAEIKDYIYDLVFAQDPSGQPDTTQVNPLFEDYTLGEMIKTLELIREYTESFLVFDENGQPVFPQASTVTPIDLDYDQFLLPGESMQFYRLIQTANLADVLTWSPIMLSITIEAPNGEDISDFAIELIFDRNPFSETDEFSYNWLLRDETTTNEYISKDGVSLTQNDLATISGETIFNTQVYRNASSQYVPILFRQMFLTPTYPGNWSRLPYGPNYYLAEPTSKSSLIGVQQMFELSHPRLQTGVILAGKANGRKSEIRLDFPIRVPYDGQSAPLIPFIIALTRGLELDASGNPLPNQSTLLVKPIIKMRVIQGQVWAG
jgi:hypothetical protein